MNASKTLYTAITGPAGFKWDKRVIPFVAIRSNLCVHRSPDPGRGESLILNPETYTTEEIEKIGGFNCAELGIEIFSSESTVEIAKHLGCQRELEIERKDTDLDRARAALLDEAEARTKGLLEFFMKNNIGPLQIFQEGAGSIKWTGDYTKQLFLH